MIAFEISNRQTGRTFSCSANETILDAALRQEIGLPHGCKSGTCGACVATVVDETDSAPGGSTPCSVRLCQIRPKRDMTISVRECQFLPQIATRKLPARVSAKEVFAGRIARLTLKLPAREAFTYRPGQYVGLIAPDARLRFFSIANAPSERQELTLLVGEIPGGHYTRHVMEQLSAGAVVWLEGPFGSFHLPASGERPRIAVAGGTGIAPLRACLEAISDKPDTAALSVYWGVRSSAELEMAPEIGRLCAKIPGSRFIPVVSEPDATWSGRTGLVHLAVLEDWPDMSGATVYACGAPVLIDAIRHDFVARAHLEADELFVDSFETGTAESNVRVA